MADFGLGIMIFGLVIYLIHLKVIPIYEGHLISSAFILIGILSFGFAHFYQFSDIEKVKSEKSGFIEFTNNELILNYS
jgi:hypothetical protein